MKKYSARKKPPKKLQKKYLAHKLLPPYRQTYMYFLAAVLVIILFLGVVKILSAFAYLSEENFSKLLPASSQADKQSTQGVLQPTPQSDQGNTFQAFQHVQQETSTQAVFNSSLLTKHFFGGFTIDNNAMSIASQLGMQVDLLYNYNQSTLDNADAHHMKVIDGSISKELLHYDLGHISEYTMLKNITNDIANVERKNIAYAKNHNGEPIIIGYWTQDDQRGGFGRHRDLLVQIRNQIQTEGGALPTICGFGPFFGDVNGNYILSPHGFYANYSPAGCDMVGLYAYANPDLSSSSNDNIDWSMKYMWDAVARGFNADTGYDLNKVPVIGMPQAIAGQDYTFPSFIWPHPRPQDVQAEAVAFCQRPNFRGLIYFSFGSDDVQTDARRDSSIQQGIAGGDSECGCILQGGYCASNANACALNGGQIAGNVSCSRNAFNSLKVCCLPKPVPTEPIFGGGPPKQSYNVVGSTLSGLGTLAKNIFNSLNLDTSNIVPSNSTPVVNYVQVQQPTPVPVCNWYEVKDTNGNCVDPCSSAQCGNGDYCWNSGISKASNGPGCRNFIQGQNGVLYTCQNRKTVKATKCQTFGDATGTGSCTINPTGNDKCTSGAYNPKANNLQ